jgi:hypothetical protein
VTSPATYATPPGTPWLPDSLRGSGVSLDGLRYAVVEEIVDSEIRTIVFAWPVLDPDGQLDFGEPEAGDEYVDRRSELERVIDERRIVRVQPPEMEEAMRARPIEVGDVFAIPRPDGGGGGPDGPGGGPGGGGGADGGLVAVVRPLRKLFDITPDARLAAQAAYSSAVAGTLTPAEVQRYLDLGTDDDDEDPSPTGGSQVPIGPQPTPHGPPGVGVPAERSLTKELTKADAVAERAQKPRTMTAGA